MQPELHQSDLFAKYIKTLHWTVETIDGQQIFVRQFPFMGGFGKMQRPYPLPSITELKKVIQKHHIKRMVIEASEKENQETFFHWVSEVKQFVAVTPTPYLQSKSIRIDLTPKEDAIFHSFSEAKRRAVRRAIKNNVTVEERASIKELIAIKNYSAGFMGFITTTGIKEMWDVFGPTYATTVLAFVDGASLLSKVNGLQYGKKELIGGILLVFWDDIAYYWIAGASHKGKKLAAPTLLAWEAMKIAKKRGMKWFDFVGVFDERFPNENLSWKGFTKFKEGFGGKTIYYPTHRSVSSK